VLGGRWRIDWPRTNRGIRPGENWNIALKLPYPDATHDFVSGFYCSKAKAGVIGCPMPVCIAKYGFEQCCNFIEIGSALLTRQRGAERVGECVEPPAHSRWQRRGAPMPSLSSGALRSAGHSRTTGKPGGREPHFKVAHP
jgi:hypothetical protein